MLQKYFIVVLAIVFTASVCVSSALVSTYEQRNLGSLPESITFIDDNSITSRSKRQVISDVDPPAAAAPLPENLPATKPTTAAPKPTTVKSALDVSGSGANAMPPGLDVIDQLSQVGDRVGQRLNARLDKLQSGVDTLVSTQVDAITDLFKSGITTGAKIPTTGLKLLVAKLRLPLYIFG